MGPFKQGHEMGFQNQQLLTNLIFCQIWISFKTMTLCLISALLRPKSFQSEVEVSNLLITIFGENYQFFITMNFLLA